MINLTCYVIICLRYVIVTWQLLNKVWADFFFFLVFGGMIFLDFIAYAAQALASAVRWDELKKEVNQY